MSKLTALLLIMLPAAAWAQQPPPAAASTEPLTGKQFLLNSNYHLTIAVHDLLDQNNKLKKDNEELTKQIREFQKKESKSKP